MVARQALAWRGGPEPRKSLIVKDLHSPDNFSLAFDDPAIVTAQALGVDRPRGCVINVNHRPTDGKDLQSVRGFGCGAKDIISFNHDYSMTKKIVLSTVFLKKIKKILDYISY